MLLVAIIVTPVTVLALVPTVFGFDRYVMTKDLMGDSIGRGDLMFDRMVPASDLEVGDVISYIPPASSGLDRSITRRVIDVGDGFIRTQADSRTEADTWSLDQRDYPAVSRLFLSVPYVGYPFLLAEGQSTWNILIASAGGLLLIVIGRDAWRSRGRRPSFRATVRV